ncbi:nucleotidyltransferase domain-containing protein [Caldisericum sp.]|uniref:nucleotidyltransferase domain-containing protein n=1 Tax=Caldisericum sp. TaxID=2499687 RepID=UPI003D10F8FA
MKELEIAKKIIVEEVEKAGFKVIDIIVYGSRARGDFNKDSDWDFLVILDRDITFEERKKITADIQFRLAMVNIPNDVILREIKQLEELKSVVGNISYYADKEGAKI